MKPATAAFATLSMLVLAGCSTMQDTSSMARKGDLEDTAYVAKVEQLAQSRGVSVHWVNPPHKRPTNEL